DNAFFLPAGTHTIEVVGATTYGWASVDLCAGATKSVDVEVCEVDVQGYAKPRQGPAPLNVSFETGFTGPRPNRLIWSFGDGEEMSDCPWASHIYQEPGTYTATLTAGWGETCDLVCLVRTVEIVVCMPGPGPDPEPDPDPNPDPNPDPGSDPILLLSATEGNAPFTLDVKVGSAGTPEKWHLDLGDDRVIEGTSPTEVNRSVTYEKAGIYPVTLTVTSGDFTNSTTKTVTVLEPPAAAFALSPREGVAPLNVTFTDRSTGNITARSWDFGDGATSTDVNPTHRYEQAGTYMVRLTVSNPYSRSNAEQSVTVSTVPDSGTVSYSSSGGGGRSSTSVGSAGKIRAEESATLTVAGSTIYEVRVTAAETISKVMVTIEKTGRPSGVRAPAEVIYEYDEMTLYRTTEDAIEDVVLSFKIPKTWLEEEGFDPGDVEMYRYYDDTWHALPTKIIGEDATFQHFSARSPGFSLFAIGGDPSPVETPVVTQEAPAETAAPLTTPPAPEPPTDTPETAPPFPVMPLVLAGAIVLLVVGVVVWRR
ncbi:MAG: PKD domain-containing protein, partial [Methanofollis sp.]|nr:PKD domain-containing protein [Methanofollis sp.]